MEKKEIDIIEMPQNHTNKHKITHVLGDCEVVQDPNPFEDASFFCNIFKYFFLFLDLQNYQKLTFID